MILLTYANYDASRLRENFGAPEYSYLFVKNAFRPVLERLGRVIEVRSPAREVDEVFQAAASRGEPCLFLPFCPPNTAPVGFACPTIPVLAWEYDTIPTETIEGEAAEDWRFVLGRTAGAITHCRSARDAIALAMGEAYDVEVIPAPLFETFSRRGSPARGWHAPFEISVDGGFALRLASVDLDPFRPGRDVQAAIRKLRALEQAAEDSAGAPAPVPLSGVIYTAVVNPYDGRKNWQDLVSGFVWAFRNTATATLLLKLTRYDLEDGLYPVLQHVSTLGRFACQIVLVHGLLSNEAYGGLIDATSYALNTAFAEGQCLPLMEYMSAGRPAVAPAHSAMQDYLTPANAFVISCSALPTWWPHDGRRAIRCTHHLISFTDYMRQLRESYRVARDEPNRYAAMSEAAVEAQRGFCSEERAMAGLRAIFARATG